MSVDPLCRFRLGGDRDRDRQGDRSSDLDDFRLRYTGRSTGYLYYGELKLSIYDDK